MTATNSAGTGPASAASNAVTPAANQTITFANPGTQNFGTTPTLTATATSGLAVTFTSSTMGVCTITSGGALTFVTTGTCTINADQAGNAAFNAAPTVSQSFTVISVPIVTTSAGATSWVESNNLAVVSNPVSIDAGLTTGDQGLATLASAIVSITANFQSNEDVLAFTNDGNLMGNIAASYNASTGVLTLTSSGATATLAQWQAALRAVMYNDTAQPPTGASRTISFVVNDGLEDSAVATKTISLITVNHPPIFTLVSNPVWPPSTQGLETLANFATITNFGQAGESGQAVLAWHVADMTDPEGVISRGSNGILIQNDGTLVYSLSGQSGTATISVQCQDNGGTSNGGNDTSAAQTFTIMVGAGWNLSVSMDDHTGGRHFFDGGDLADYTIQVENIGTSDVHNATVQDMLPSNLLAPSWTCEPISPAMCTASGTGNISDTVNIPTNGAVIYHLMATVQTDPELPVTNTATVTTSVSEPDIDTSNNTVTIVDQVGIFADGFETLSYPLGMDIPVTAEEAQTRVVTMDVSHVTLKLQPLRVARVHDGASTRMAEVHLRQDLGQTEVRLSWRGDNGLWRPGAWQALNDPAHLALAWSTEAGSHHDWPLAEVELAQGVTTLARVGTDR